MFGYTKKLQDIEEQRRNARIAKANEELLEHLTSSVGYLLYQNEKYGLVIPNVGPIQDSVQRAQSLLIEISTLTSLDYQPKGNTDNIPTRKQNRFSGSLTSSVVFIDVPVGCCKLEKNKE